MLSVLAALAVGAALATMGAMAGIFFAFSVAVMPGLDAIGAGNAVRAMQSINRKILNPLFLLMFMGAPVAAAAAVGLLLVTGERGAAATFFLAAAVYVFGAFVPTIVVNVPMNEALERAGEPESADEATRTWAGYAPRWTRWNSVRAFSCAVGLLLVGLGLFVWGRQG